MHSIESGTLPERMRGAVSLAWSLFAKKVGGGLITINKEASMQLQLGYILQQLRPLIIFEPDESLELELETGVSINESNREIDVLLSGQSGASKHRIAARAL